MTRIKTNVDLRIFQFSLIGNIYSVILNEPIKNYCIFFVDGPAPLAAQKHKGLLSGQVFMPYLLPGFIICEKLIQYECINLTFIISSVQNRLQSNILCLNFQIISFQYMLQLLK